MGDICFANRVLISILQINIIGDPNKGPFFSLLPHWHTLLQYFGITLLTVPVVEYDRQYGSIAMEVTIMENTETLIQIADNLEEVGFLLSGMSMFMAILEEHDIRQADMFRLLRKSLDRMEEVVLVSAGKIKVAVNGTEWG